MVVVFIVWAGLQCLGISTHLFLRKIPKEAILSVCFISVFLNLPLPRNRAGTNLLTLSQAGILPLLCLKLINKSKLSGGASNSLNPPLFSSIFSALGITPNSKTEIKVLTSQGCSKDKHLRLSVQS